MRVIAGLCLSWPLQDVRARHERQPCVALPPCCVVEYRQFALLRHVVPRDNADHAMRPRNRTKVYERRRIPGVVPVVLRLHRAVRVHGEKGLLEARVSVIVLIARVEEPPVGQFLRIERRPAVVAEPPDARAVRLAHVDIRVLGAVTGDDLHATGGLEGDSSVGQPARLEIGARIRIGESQLDQPPRLQVKRVEVVVVAVGPQHVRQRTTLSCQTVLILGEGLAHGKHDHAPVERHVRIADATVRSIQQHLVRDRPVLSYRQQAELSAAPPVARMRAVALVRGLRVSGKLRIAADGVVLDVDDVRACPCHAGKTTATAFRTCGVIGGTVRPCRLPETFEAEVLQQPVLSQTAVGEGSRRMRVPRRIVVRQRVE